VSETTLVFLPHTREQHSLVCRRAIGSHLRGAVKLAPPLPCHAIERGRRFGSDATSDRSRTSGYWAMRAESWVERVQIRTRSGDREHHCQRHDPRVLHQPPPSVTRPRRRVLRTRPRRAPPDLFRNRPPAAAAVVEPSTRRRKDAVASRLTRALPRRSREPLYDPLELFRQFGSRCVTGAAVGDHVFVRPNGDVAGLPCRPENGD
jgi:hypothetical protein